MIEKCPGTDFPDAGSIVSHFVKEVSPLESDDSLSEESTDKYEQIEGDSVSVAAFHSVASCQYNAAFSCLLNHIYCQ